MHSSGKRIIALGLIASLAFSSFACGKKKKEKKKEFVTEDDAYFTATSAEINYEYKSDQKLQYSEASTTKIIGNSVVVGYENLYEFPDHVRERFENLIDPTEEEIYELSEIAQKYFERGLAVYDFDGKQVTDIKLPYNSELLNFAEGREGTIICMVRNIDFETLDEKNALCIYSAEGLQTESIDLPEDVQGWVEDILVTKDGKFLLVDYGMVQVISPQGELLGEWKEDNFYGDLVEVDDKYYVIIPVYDEDTYNVTYYYQEFDPSEADVKGKRKTLDMLFSGIMSGGDGKCYCLDGNGIQMIDMESGKKEEFLNWDSTDVNYTSYSEESVKVMSKDRVAFLRTDYQLDKISGEWDAKTVVVTLTRTEKNPHAGKKYIDLGIIGVPSDDLLDYIIHYNTTEGNKARIRVIDYTSGVEIADTYLDQQTSLSDKVYLEMLGGTGPDILVNFSCFSQFNSEEVLVDLNTYVDGPNGLNREEYFDNVLSAFEDKNKLFQIPVCFDIQGLIGNREMIGERSGWTYSEFHQIVEDLPSVVTVMDKVRYNDILNSLLSVSMLSFIDYSKKETYFDGDEFRQLLLIAKEYGTDRPKYYEDHTQSIDDVILSIDDTLSDDDSPEDRMNEGMLALMEAYVYNIYQYSENRAILNGETIYIGMPSPDGTGVSAEPILTLAISAFSSSKDEAWDFIRHLFDEDSQYTYSKSLGSIPLNRKAFDRINEEEIAENQQMIADYEAYKQEYGEDYLTYYMRISKEDADGFRELVENVSTITSSDPAVLSIIEEEAAAYFYDEKSAEDVCRVIQNRTSTIVHER